MSITRILTEVVHEIGRANDKHGRQLDTRDGTGGTVRVETATVARHQCEEAFASGNGTWRHILTEEVVESYAETDPALLRAELIQVAAVAVRWIDVIDERVR